MTVLTPWGGPPASWYIPNDTPPTKPCTVENGIATGATITRNAQDLVIASPASDPTAFAALPAGNTVTHFASGNHTSQQNLWTTGGLFAPTDPTGRRAARWYRYYSPNFEFIDDQLCPGPGCGTCYNDKTGEMGTATGLPMGGGFEQAQWTPAMYTWQADSNWQAPAGTPLLDCCNHGPGQDGNAPMTSAMKGHWFRMEWIGTHADGTAGMYFLFLVKDITANTPEFVAIDTRIPGPNAANPWTPASASVLQYGNPPMYGGISILASNMNRDSSPCTGWGGIMYYMSAAWSTDSGQRIGAAVEVEGTGGPTNTLTTTVTGSGIVSSAPFGISCPTNCSYAFSTGSNVTLTATPNTGATFTGWSGGGCSGTGTCVVNMSANVTVMATFSTVSAGSCGSGTTLAIFSGGGNHLQNQGTGALACQ
jgi:hypothetical protein